MVRMLASSHEGSVFLPNKPPASWDPFVERICKGTSLLLSLGTQQPPGPSPHSLHDPELLSPSDQQTE